ncbi:hypothetical protein ACRALDRAFT_1090673 [Sodiomyces alcalophilus JCM 7366]|uniref:uncharacterized protein n=1 Tax=Sodiomyces alcalophilus JCM 7366 TaxID=591952 RepID=UPI0039B6E608
MRTPAVHGIGLITKPLRSRDDRRDNSHHLVYTRGSSDGSTLIPLVGFSSSSLGLPLILIPSGHRDPRGFHIGRIEFTAHSSANCLSDGRSRGLYDYPSRGLYPPHGHEPEWTSD